MKEFVGLWFEMSLTLSVVWWALVDCFCVKSWQDNWILRKKKEKKSSRQRDIRRSFSKVVSECYSRRVSRTSNLGLCLTCAPNQTPIRARARASIHDFLHHFFSYRTRTIKDLYRFILRGEGWLGDFWRAEYAYSKREITPGLASLGFLRVSQIRVFGGTLE